MAYISFQPTDFFNTVLYTGNGSTQTITGTGFQPNLTWIKGRDNTEYYRLYDSVRGATKEIYSNANLAEGTNANSLTSWNADGFAVGTETGVNTNTDDYSAWNWKAGTTSGLSGGTITPSAYSINTTSGVGIYQYAGTSSNGTIAHGLGTAPECVIVKKVSAADAWWVYHQGTGAGKYMVLDTTAAPVTNSAAWNDSAPTDTLIHLGTAGNTNSSSGSPTYIMYAFAPVKGFSSFGKYYGNNNDDGPFIYTGFRPAFLMVKQSNDVGDWLIMDDKRVGYNPDNNYFKANATSASQGAANKCDILSNGFKPRSSGAGHDLNGASDTYNYMAFAEFPMVSSNSKAGTAR